VNISGQVILKADRDGPVRGGNPWIFSQAIARIEPDSLEPGALVAVRDFKGAMIGMGHFNPRTTIAVRMLYWGDEAISLEELLGARLANAWQSRSRFIGGETNCYRLVNGEGDGLPGLVVDRYANVLVVQFLSAGMDSLRANVVEALTRLFKPQSIFERSVGAVRRQEGLTDRVGLLAGEQISEVLVIENGIKIAVDLEHGQKTGYFLDQRENRMLFARLARGLRVLDGCCYEGGFALAALAEGAQSVVAVDTSARALELAQINREMNGLDASRISFIRADVATFLKESRQRFDLIVLDPPPLARSRTDVPRAERLYVELNGAALAALSPGGMLMTFSCSTHFRGEDFVRAIRIAQTRASSQMRLMARLGAGPDHPVLLGHVEGEYLTGVLLESLR